MKIKNLLSFITFLLLFSGCGNDTPPLISNADKMPVQSSLGYNIPVFSTAQEQLNYAKSGFNDFKEKKAAFKIISHLFPDNKEICGKAALYDAYLTLGYDYRFADKGHLLKAVEAYQNILISFRDHPNVMVKAYWYLGWIHCDLMGEKRLGIKYFWLISNQYPDMHMGITPPVPWVSLVYPENEKSDQPKVPKEKNTWASTALLEIIRHTNDNEEAVRAFETLWNSYKDSRSTGLALLIMLKAPQNRKFAKNYIKPFLAINTTNPYITDEIRTYSKGL